MCSWYVLSRCSCTRYCCCCCCWICHLCEYEYAWGGLLALAGRCGCPRMGAGAPIDDMADDGDGHWLGVIEDLAGAICANAPTEAPPLHRGEACVEAAADIDKAVAHRSEGCDGSRAHCSGSGG